MKHGVAVLEQLFEKSKSDAKVLAQLRHELEFREVPKARALLGRVQEAISDLGKSGTPPASSADRQGSLWDASSTPEIAIPTPRPPKNANHKPAALAKNTCELGPEMSLEDAYRLLKVATNASWEEIERSRRALVQQSHPSKLVTYSQQRKLEIQAGAKRINHAYHVLAMQRILSR